MCVCVWLMNVVEYLINEKYSLYYDSIKWMKMIMNIVIDKRFFEEGIKKTQKMEIGVHHKCCENIIIAGC